MASLNPAELPRGYNLLLDLSAITDGVYIWEFFITLGYEWDTIRGHRPYRWTIWIYSICRLSTLMAVVMDQIAAHLTTNHCQAIVSFNFIFPNLGLCFASLLILIRIAAIWNMNKPAVVLATLVWLTNVAFLIRGAALIRSTLIRALHLCGPPNVEISKPTIITTFVTDITLLLIMLVGLFRLRRRGGGWFALGRLLWKQGVLWLTIAAVAGIIPVVFISLNLSLPLDMMFLRPNLITLTISATRMYRSLTDFWSNTDLSLETVRRSRRSAQNATNLSNGRMEVAVHTTHERFVTSSKEQCVSFVSMQHVRDKAHEQSLHESADDKV